MQILIIGDDLEMRSMLERGLLRAGHRVTAAQSGREAVDQLWILGSALDVVVVDLALDRGGEILLEDLRQLSSRTPVVVLSAVGPEEIAVRFAQDRLVRHLTMPVGLDDLLKTVDAVRPPTHRKATVPIRLASPEGRRAASRK